MAGRIAALATTVPQQVAADCNSREAAANRQARLCACDMRDELERRQWRGRQLNPDLRAAGAAANA